MHELRIMIILKTFPHMNVSHQLSGDSNDENDEQTSDDPLDIPFTQMFIKKKENIELIFDIIRDKDYLDCRFRPQALKLFNAISRNRPKDIQDFILSTPMGVSTLVDLLSDFRDFIRLDAISLLTRLAKNNASIQKIAAYENAFDKLIATIEAEEFAAGGWLAIYYASIQCSIIYFTFICRSYCQRLSRFATESLEKQ